MKSRVFLTILVVALLFPISFAGAQDDIFDIHAPINQGPSPYLFFGTLETGTNITGEVKCEETLAGIRAGYSMFILNNIGWQFVTEGRTEELESSSFYRVTFGRFENSDNDWITFEYTTPENDEYYFYFMQTIGLTLDHPATAEGYVNMTYPAITTTTNTTPPSSTTPTTTEPGFFDKYHTILYLGLAALGLIVGLITYNDRR